MGRPGHRPRRLGAGFWTLWTASAVSNLGDGVSYVAWPWLAGTLTRDPPAIAGLPVATRLPWLLLALPAGALVDRVDRRRLMAAVNLCRFAVTALVAAAVLSGTMTLPLLYAAALLLGCGEVVYDTAALTILPGVVERGRLQRANATMWSAETVLGAFVGPPLGGLLLAGSFRVRRPPGAPGERRSLRREVAEAVRWLWDHPLLRALALLAGGIAWLMRVQYATFVLYAQEVLRLDARGFGLLSTATAAGAVLGSQLAPAISRRVGPRAALLLAVGGLAPAYAAIGLTTSGALVAAAYVAEGFLILVWNVITVSLRQQVAPDAVLGRVNSVYNLLVHGATPLGSLAGGALVAAAGALAGRELGLRAPFLLTAVAMVALLAVAARLVTSARIEAAAPTT